MPPSPAPTAARCKAYSHAWNLSAAALLGRRASEYGASRTQADVVGWMLRRGHQCAAAVHIAQRAHCSCSHTTHATAASHSLALIKRLFTRAHLHPGEP